MRGMFRDLFVVRNQFNPDRRVVARLLPAPDVGVDLRVREPGG
jgi:hypothetical protein